MARIIKLGFGGNCKPQIDLFPNSNLDSSIARRETWVLLICVEVGDLGVGCIKIVSYPCHETAPQTKIQPPCNLPSLDSNEPIERPAHSP